MFMSVSTSSSFLTGRRHSPIRQRHHDRRQEEGEMDTLFGEKTTDADSDVDEPQPDFISGPQLGGEYG